MNSQRSVVSMKAFQTIGDASRQISRSVRDLAWWPSPGVGKILSEIRSLRAQVELLQGQVQVLQDRQAVYVGNETALTTLFTGQPIFADTRGADLGAHLIMGGQWETNYVNLFRRLIRPGDTVLDLGVNHGVYTLVAAAAVGPTGKVIGFEAQSRMHRLATMSCLINGFRHIVTLHNKAVSNESGPVTIYVNDLNPSGSSLDKTRADRDTGAVIDAVRLDDFLPDLTVDVVKCDIDGWDGCAIVGMRDMLARSKNVKLMIEWYPKGLLGSPVGPQALIDAVSALGLQMWIIDQNGGLSRGVWAEIMAPLEGIQNLLLAREGVL
jgi:FkbM family methyltransferase